MSRIESLISSIIDKILSEENANYRRKMGLNSTDEELLNLAKEQLAYTESVFPIEWEQLPEYVEIDSNSKVSLKDEYKPKILHSYLVRNVDQPVSLTIAHDGNYIITDNVMGGILIGKDNFDIKDVVLRSYYNTTGYRWYEDNERIYGGFLVPFSIEDNNYYLWMRVITYGDFIIKCFDENYNYLWMKRMQYTPDVFSARFWLINAIAIDHNNILIASNHGGDTDNSGAVIGDAGVIYLAKIDTDSNDVPTGISFYRKTDGYPVAMLGVQDRYINNILDPENAYGIQRIKYINGKLYSLHTAKIQEYNIESLGDGTNPPVINFNRLYTTPAEIRDWITNWTAKDMIFRIEDGVPYIYVVIANPPLLYGIAKINMLNFKLISFVGDYLYTYNQQYSQVNNPDDIYGLTEDLGNIQQTQTGVNFGNIVGFADTPEGLFVVDYGNRDTKLIPYALFDTVGTIAISKEHAVPKMMEITKVMAGSQGKYYISINRSDWQKITGEFFAIPANTPFKIKRKFYAYELMKGPLDISLRFLVQ